MTRGADDETLLLRMRSAAAQRGFFMALARSFQPSYAYGFSGDIVFELDTTLPGQEPTVDVWTIEVTGLRARARRGPSPRAAATVRLGVADFVRLIAGTLDPISALRDNRLEVEGQLLIAARMDEMFGGARPIHVLRGAGPYLPDPYPG
jgi:hypothetical protein